MTTIDLKTKSIEELWVLHEEIASTLASRMEAEKLKLKKRLDQLGIKESEPARQNGVRRRPYPEVHPKFQNPNPPHQTWSGRGKQPIWMRKLLAEGMTMNDLRISGR